MKEKNFRVHNTYVGQIFFLRFTTLQFGGCKIISNTGDSHAVKSVPLFRSIITRTTTSTVHANTFTIFSCEYHYCSEIQEQLGDYFFRISCWVNPFNVSQHRNDCDMSHSHCMIASWLASSQPSKTYAKDIHISSQSFRQCHIIFILNHLKGSK